MLALTVYNFNLKLDIMGRPIMSDADRVDGFRGLAHPLRRRVLRMLGREGELTVHQLLAAFDTTPQALSRHLAVLRETGLVAHRAAGASRIYRLRPAGLKRLGKWLNHAG